MARLEGIENDLLLMKSFLGLKDSHNSKVSNWSVHKQIEHLLVSDKLIMGMILDRSLWSVQLKRKTLIGRLCLGFGFIPRGKAKAPEMVVPQGADLEILQGLMLEVYAQFDEIKKLFAQGKISKEIIGKHPYFGGLNIKDWLRMIEIHQRHHLKIISDIVSAARN